MLRTTECSRTSNHIYTTAQTGKITQQQSVHLVLVVLRHISPLHDSGEGSFLLPVLSGTRDRASALQYKVPFW